MKTCPREHCKWLKKISALSGTCVRGKCYDEEQVLPDPPPPPEPRPKEYFTWNPPSKIIDSEG